MERLVDLGRPGAAAGPVLRPLRRSPRSVVRSRSPSSRSLATPPCELRTETGSNPVILVAAIVATLVVLLLFSIDTAQNEPETFVVMLVIGALTVVFDFVWKHLRDPATHHPRPTHAARFHERPGTAVIRHRGVGPRHRPDPPRLHPHSERVTCLGGLGVGRAHAAGGRRPRPLGTRGGGRPVSRIPDSWCSLRRARRAGAVTCPSTSTPSRARSEAPASWSASTPVAPTTTTCGSPRRCGVCSPANSTWRSLSLRLLRRVTPSRRARS